MALVGVLVFIFASWMCWAWIQAMGESVASWWRDKQEKVKGKGEVR